MSEMPGEFISQPERHKGQLTCPNCNFTLFLDENETRYIPAQGKNQVILRCFGDCGKVFPAMLSSPETGHLITEFAKDKKLILDEANRLAVHIMNEEIEIFAAALDKDLISADDFGQRRPRI
jgi:uncharacterized Zn finger protein